jgi:hypothetical protein
MMMDWVDENRWKAAGITIAVGVAAITLCRGVRQFLRAPQITDQPLVEWVNNTDYDGMFWLWACVMRHYVRMMLLCNAHVMFVMMLCVCCYDV